MLNKEKEIIKFSARIPKNIDEKVKECARDIGISKNDILILALREYVAKEVNA